jgi:serine phosphatase RsbU (regulator of sigma subunit)
VAGSTPGDDPVESGKRVSVADPVLTSYWSDETILLVEDDQGDAVLVQACLAEAGVPDRAFNWVRTLAGALDALRDRPACVLLDLGLPDADGYGAVVKMVGAAPDIPVIVLTGRQERNGVEALSAGAQDYLAKDLISSELLERAIRYAMERKRAQATQQQLQLSAAEQRRLERGLLPNPLLRTDTVTSATYYRPGRDGAVLGGDFFDVVETADGRIRAVIGDVMGHGPDEAALGVHLRVAWRTLVLAETRDAQILPSLARLLQMEPDQARRFVTVCDLTYADGELSVRLAGHPAPIICADGEPRYLDAEVGPPLGMGLSEASAGWPELTISLHGGSSIVLYTDGLLEAYTDTNSPDSIGVETLVGAIASCSAGDAPPEIWLPNLLSTAPRESIDDTALVVLNVTPRE